MDAGQVPSEPLSWRYNPWKEQPVKTVLVFVINCAVLLVVYYSYYGDAALRLFLLVTALVMFGMTLPLLVPITYKLDSKGVTVYFLGVPSFRSWPHYRNIYVHNNGIFLTSMKRPSRLDPFRGHFLLYGYGNREQIVSHAKRFIKPEA